MPCLADPPYDIVVVLLDDMRFDEVAVMEQTVARLEPQAVQFDRAYVTTPLCCPERASFLSGGWYAHQTGVLTNEAPTGGATRFADADTLPVRLQDAGYTTALVGKYLNEYDSLGLYVPPGWTYWAATGDAPNWEHIAFVEGSSTSVAATGAATEAAGYMTDWQTAEMMSVLDAHPEEPVFAYLSYLAPHEPHTPAAEDTTAFLDFLYRDRAWNEADVSDKPAWIRAVPQMSEAELAEADQNNRERLQTLLAVDRGVARLIDAVRASPRADRTVFLFTSDNGQMWHEHRLSGKGVAYEESVRVPVWIAHPDLAPGNTATLVASNLDLAATVAALAGLEPTGEGVSLIPVVCDGADTGRDEILLQAWSSDPPAWSALVTADRKYIETAGGERELYDLLADPYELESRHTDPDEADTMAALAARLDAVRGLAIDEVTLPDALVGEAYDEPLHAWGGTAPLTWSLADGTLPPGLSLDPAGRITGVPEAVGKTTVLLAVLDSGSSPVHGGPQAWRASVHLTVEPAPESAKPLDSGAGACGCVADGTATGRTFAGAVFVALVTWARRRHPAHLPPGGPHR